MFGKILWTTDFSEVAEASLPYAEALAGLFDAELLLCHVIPDTPFFYASLVGQMEALIEALETTRNAAQERLNKIAERLARKGVGAKPVLLEGSPYAEIVKFAEAEGVDLIVMSTRGLKGFERVLVGSTTEKVMRKAHCPVLAVHRAPEGPVEFKNIVLLTDLSELSRKALPVAEAIAKASGGKITVLHVLETDVPLPPEDEKALVDAILSGMPEPSVPHEKRVVKAPTAVEGVRKFVLGNPVDLVVSATHGRTGLAKVLLGSVVEGIFKRVEVPLLVVRAR